MSKRIMHKLLAATLAISLGSSLESGWRLTAQVLISRGPVGPEPSLRLGPGDQVSVWVRDVEEISERIYRIEDDGTVRIPLIGAVRMGGLTLKEVETSLIEPLKKVVLEPQVHLAVTELRSNPSTVTGAVKNPGVIQIRDRVTVLQAISMAGGLDGEAGRYVRITRQIQYGKIPLATAQMDSSNQFSWAEEDLNELMNGTNAVANLAVQPQDVINVLSAPVVYIMGEVHRTGEVPLTRKAPVVTVLEAIARAEGMTEIAAPKKALILRARSDAPRENIPIDIKKVLEGKADDLKLVPNDILFIPNNKSTAKTIALQALQIATSVSTGVVILKAGQRR
jgi:polysaccharide export outer membrane protein